MSVFVFHKIIPVLKSPEEQEGGIPVRRSSSLILNRKVGPSGQAQISAISLASAADLDRIISLGTKGPLGLFVINRYYILHRPSIQKRILKSLVFLQREAAQSRLYQPPNDSQKGLCSANQRTRHYVTLFALSMTGCHQYSTYAPSGPIPSEGFSISILQVPGPHTLHRSRCRRENPQVPRGRGKQVTPLILRQHSTEATTQPQR